MDPELRQAECQLDCGRAGPRDASDAPSSPGGTIPRNSPGAGNPSSHSGVKQFISGMGVDDADPQYGYEPIDLLKRVSAGGDLKQRAGYGHRLDVDRRARIGRDSGNNWDECKIRSNGDDDVSARRRP